MKKEKKMGLGYIHYKHRAASNQGNKLLGLLYAFLISCFVYDMTRNSIKLGYACKYLMYYSSNKIHFVFKTALYTVRAITRTGHMISCNLIGSYWPQIG